MSGEWRLTPAQIAEFPREEQLELLEVELLFDFRAWANTPVGKHMNTQALMELRAARDELEKVDPANPDEVRRVQMKAAVARSFLQWTMDVYKQGELSHQRLHAADQREEFNDH